MAHDRTAQHHARPRRRKPSSSSEWSGSAVNNQRMLVVEDRLGPVERHAVYCPGTFTPAARWTGTLAGAVLILVVGGSYSAQTTRADVPLQWVPFVHLPGVVDLSGPRPDGSLTVTAGGSLFLLQPPGTLRSFARGSGGYATDP